MDYERIASCLRAIAHPIRFRILEILLREPICVSDLGEKLDCKQPNISQHLAILRDRGLIEPVRQENKVCYHVKDPRIGRLIQLAAEMFGQRRES
jgi:ArsR family transcriptional regulator